MVVSTLSYVVFWSAVKLDLSMLLAVLLLILRPIGIKIDRTKIATTAPISVTWPVLFILLIFGCVFYCF